MTTNFLLSIIIPVYNEEKSISLLLERLLPIIKLYDHEIIFVDDGSTDKTIETIKKYSQKNPKIKSISFYRNFGHQMALTAGYQLAKGNCVISIDADLQDSPDAISQMIDKWQKGARVVYAKRGKREVDSFFKHTTAKLFYKFINLLSDTNIPEDVGDFRLLDRQVVDFLNNLPEQARFLRGLVSWGGYPADYVYYRREKRVAGVTHYTFSKMLNFALDGITSFSTKPLRIASFIGILSASVGFLGVIYAILSPIVNPSHYVTGWAALFVGITFLGGVQLLTIGIIGEYIGKIYKEIQHRPQFLIKERVNI